MVFGLILQLGKVAVTHIKSVPVSVTTVALFSKCKEKIMLCKKTAMNKNTDTCFGEDLQPIYFGKMALTALSTKYFRRSSKICIREIADNPPSEWMPSKFSVELEKNP